MPTNLLRPSTKKAVATVRIGHAPDRLVEIRAGRATIRAQLLETPTADRIWRALPLFSTVEIWGQEVHFATAVASGRERGARVLAALGDIAWIPERDWVSILYGPTPTSKAGELRLWSPANIWARAIDDVRCLTAARPGEAASIRAVAAMASPAGASG